MDSSMYFKTEGWDDPILQAGIQKVVDAGQDEDGNWKGLDGTGKGISALVPTLESLPVFVTVRGTEETYITYVQTKFFEDDADLEKFHALFDPHDEDRLEVEPFPKDEEIRAAKEFIMEQRLEATEAIKPNGYRAHNWEDKETGERFSLVGITLDPKTFTKALALWEGEGPSVWFTPTDPEDEAYIAFVSADFTEAVKVELPRDVVEMATMSKYDFVPKQAVPEDMRLLIITSSDLPADLDGDADFPMIDVPLPEAREEEGAAA